MTTNYDSHIILYAKGHYKITNVFSDLRKIYAKRNGIEAKFISKQVVISSLLKLVWQCDIKNDSRRLVEFIDDILPRQNWWKFDSKSPTNILFGKKERYRCSYPKLLEIICKKCLSILRNLQISEIDDKLSETDPSILPLQKELL